MDEHKTVRTKILEIGYLESGPADGPAVILLHGWPSDVHDWDGVAPPLAAAGFRVLVPWLRGFGPTRFLDAATPRSGQQAALGADVRDFMDALSIQQAILAGYDWGGRAACVAAALWPERVSGLVAITGYGIQDIAASARPAVAEQEHRYWYQWYFHTERGRAGLTANRDGIAKLLWRLWSPNWAFDDATFLATAPASTILISSMSPSSPTGIATATPPAIRPTTSWRLAWPASRRSRCRRSSCTARMTASARRPDRSRATGCSPAAWTEN